MFPEVRSEDAAVLNPSDVRHMFSTPRLYRISYCGIIGYERLGSLMNVWF